MTYRPLPSVGDLMYRSNAPLLGGQQLPALSQAASPAARHQQITVQGESGSVYTITRVPASSSRLNQDFFRCTCPSFFYKTGQDEHKTCKHIIGLNGEDYERSRLAFSGNAHLVDQILGNLKAKADGGPKRKELSEPVMLHASSPAEARASPPSGNQVPVSASEDGQASVGTSTGPVTPQEHQDSPSAAKNKRDNLPVYYGQAIVKSYIYGQGMTNKGKIVGIVATMANGNEVRMLTSNHPSIGETISYRFRELTMKNLPKRAIYCGIAEVKGPWDTQLQAANEPGPELSESGS